jgi:hypothetical protein
MGEACSLLSFYRSAIPLCSHESMVMLNYDYLIVKNDDTKKWLTKLPCMFSLGC